MFGILGFTYDFEIYSGQKTHPNNRHKEEPDLEAASYIGVRMTQNVTKNVKVYFDNYFTSVNLMVYLSHHGIQASSLHSKL